MWGISLVVGVRWEVSTAASPSAVCGDRRGLWAAHGSEQPSRLLGRKPAGWMDRSCEPHPTAGQCCVWDRLTYQFLNQNGASLMENERRS